MGQTLEAFAKKNHLRIRISTIAITETGGWKKGIRRKIEWQFDLLPPTVLRYFRVEKDDSSSTLVTKFCKTRKQAREDLLNRIRGGVLAYSNHFDRECGKDPKIKVPKNTR